jgi:hypothetical protein
MRRILTVVSTFDIPPTTPVETEEIILETHSSLSQEDGDEGDYYEMDSNSETDQSSTLTETRSSDNEYV